MENTSNFQYDVFVIGGGSGGLSCAKKAASLGAKTGLADFVKPTPQGSKWGLGGTCVNVGCIPKKLMHFAGSMYEGLKEYELIGYPDALEKKHSWETMVGKIQLYIKKLNYGYKGQLRDSKVEYHNKLARFVDKNTIELTDAKGKKTTVTAAYIVVAVGGRPNYPDVPGSKEFGITSDDIFSLKKAPGKSLIVGASYIALECAGFLTALGYPTSVMVRSILLRGFDRDAADKIGEYMEEHGTRFIHQSVPSKFEKQENGRILVTYDDKLLGKANAEEFDTVLFAIGRTADTQDLSLEKADIKVGKNLKIIVDKAETSSVKNIFAIGDCANERPELTPPAIMAGSLLARRIINKENVIMDYTNIATTVFTPLEYGCVGLSEEDAKQTYGEDNIQIYHSVFKPLEWNFDLDRIDNAYCKIITNSYDNNKVVGFHILSPNAGEITQGIAVAVKLGVTKDQLDQTVGIHPTIAEEFTTMNKIKGEDDGVKGGC